MKGYIPDIIEEVKSGIIHIVHVVDGKRVSSGTGFMVNGYLVTNYHVIDESDKNSYILLRTYDLASPKYKQDEPDKFLDLNGIKVTRNYRGEFSSIAGSNQKNQDYFVLHIPELEERSKKGELHNFSLDCYKHKKRGEEILFIGYHFENYHIVSHRGFISSFYKSNGVDKIQIDASVNTGSSGSPLIDPDTSRVIGIVTRKETGLSDNFKEVRKTLEKTKNILENHRQNIQSENDFFQYTQDRKISQVRNDTLFNNQSILATQNNMQSIENDKSNMLALTTNLSNSITEISKINDNLINLTKEINRSANVGIGYAFSVEHLMNENFYIEG